MQFRNTIVLAFAAIFMAVSCITVDKSIGEGLIPEDQDIPVFTAELDLPVQIKSAQPLQGLSSSEAVFGTIRTPENGLVQFATAADFRPNLTGWNFGKDAVVKEVYFLANISEIFVPEDDQAGIPQIITLHRTYKNIDTATVFNNDFTEADYDPEPVNLSETVYFGGDSLKVILKNSFGEEILTATQAERDTMSLFMKRFKGLLIKASAPEEGIYGGRENFLNFGSGTIYISVNFQPTWSEGLVRKDTLFALTYGNNTCLNLSTYESVSLQTDNPGDVLNFEGAAGNKPYISKTALKKVIDEWIKKEGLEGKTVIIAKGSLVFPFEIPEDMDMTKYPPTIYPCNREYDTTYHANVFYPVIDVNTGGYSIGNMNRSLKEYKMDIPSIIQDFVSKDISELDDLTHNLWVMPIKSTTDSYYGTVTYNLDHGTYYMGKLNGPASANGRCPKLHLVYSVLDN